jgi:hypothetical protein
VYVLANHKKHVREPIEPVDRCSSAPWFDGFADVSSARLDALARGVGPPTRAPRTWLGAVAWRRRGLICAWEAPARR